jgi:D-alanyl-D-alanine carboxypeptidase
MVPFGRASDGTSKAGASKVAGEPSITAKSAVIMDALSGRVLWSRGMDTPRFPASTTKVMTALLLVERCKPDELIVAPAGIERVDPSSMHLRAGEKVSAHDMLYALMLRSANDGAVAVARHISGSVAGFAKLMNERAKELGCTETNFENPNGLNNRRHVTSAHDLALIAREAMKHEAFREVVRSVRYRISRSMNQKDVWMVSKNKLLRHDKTVDGVKTGWTVPAGHCYVGSAFRKGVRLITVVLHSNGWQADDEALVNWGYENFEPQFLTGERAPHAELGCLGHKVEIGAPDGVYALVRQGEAPVRVDFVVDPKLSSGKGEIGGPVEVGQQVGTFRIGSGDEAFEVPALALNAVSAKPIAASVTPGRLNWPTAVLGLGLAGGALAMRKKARSWLGAAS